jgi:peptide/nickel transport system ATP-binding protein
MTIPLLEARDVRKTYLVRAGVFQTKLPLHAVNGVSLTVEKRSIFGLVGESGCGKTTIARMLLGLETPTEGGILVEGVPLPTLDRIAIARRAQPVFQDPYSSLNPRKTIGSIISLPLHVHKVGTRRGRRREVEQMMELVGLPRGLYNNYPNQLSGGQRQRVAVARALIMKPSVVICDEPTSALDVSVQAQILNLLQDLQRDLGLTYVIISHNLAVVQHMATRVAVMYLGRIVEEAETQTLFSSPKHPYTWALLGSVLTPDPEFGVPNIELGTAFPNPIDPPSGCTFHPRCPERFEPCSQLRPRRVTIGSTHVECHLYDTSAEKVN